MPRIIETTVYEFHELSRRGKDKARAWFREGVGDWDWHDFIYDDFEKICRILGVALETPSGPPHGRRHAAKALHLTSPASARRATAPASRAL